MTLESAERIAAQPWFLLAFNAAFGATWAVFGLDAGNLFISVLTANLVLFGLSGSRRHQIATQAKLDELIACTTGARDKLTHAEELSETQISEARL